MDPNECMGYYSMYRTDKGKLRFYDYCVPVRGEALSSCSYGTSASSLHIFQRVPAAGSSSGFQWCLSSSSF